MHDEQSLHKAVYVKVHDAVHKKNAWGRTRKMHEAVHLRAWGRTRALHEAVHVRCMRPFTSIRIFLIFSYLNRI